MDEQPLDDVFMTSQVSSSHASGFVHMGKAAFHQFSALAQQPFRALTPDPPTVLINSRLLFFLADPLPAPAVRL